MSFLKFFEISNEERMIIEHGQGKKIFFLNDTKWYKLQKINSCLSFSVVVCRCLSLCRKKKASLTILEKKHDCFKEATTTLKNGCKNVNLSNNDKMQCKFNQGLFFFVFLLNIVISFNRFIKFIIKFLWKKDAIRLAKCELATANLAFPMECDDFDHDVGKCIECVI